MSPARCGWVCVHGNRVTVNRGLGVSETMPLWIFWASIGIGVAMVVYIGWKILRTR